MGTGPTANTGQTGNDTDGIRLLADYEIVKLGLSVSGRGDGLTDQGTRIALDALARIFHAANGGQ